MAERGDSSFAEFARAYGPRLLRTAYLLVGERGMAEDLLQTALAKTYVAWPRIEDHAAAGAYTRKVVVNTATSWWRRAAWRNERPVDPLPDTVVEGFEDDLVVRHSLRGAIARLPARQRAVVVLRYFDDHTEVQTAEVLGCSVGTVKSQAHAAIGRLRIELRPAFAAMWARTGRPGRE